MDNHTIVPGQEETPLNSKYGQNNTGGSNAWSDTTGKNEQQREDIPRDDRELVGAGNSLGSDTRAGFAT